MPRPWADQPLKLVASPRSQWKETSKAYPQAYKVADGMTTAHNTLIRCLNCILLQARNIGAEDVKDFLLFCQVTCDAIGLHHKTEETLMFPLFEQHSKPGIMGQNVVQHEEFHPGFHMFDTYVRQVQNGVASFDGAEIVRLVEAFSEPLCRHLEDEIKTLCLLESYDVPWALYFEKVTAHAMATADLVGRARTSGLAFADRLQTFVTPLVLCNMDPSWEDGIHLDHWPPFPWYAQAFVRWWYFPKYKGAWRFGSCDATGRPKELPFA